MQRSRALASRMAGKREAGTDTGVWKPDTSDEGDAEQLNARL